MDSDTQSDTEEVRRMAEENRKSIERLREELRRLKAQIEFEEINHEERPGPARQ